MNEDLKLIKKKFGEKMAHLCRELFPGILETEGLLPKLLLDNFDASHELYDDIVKQKLINKFKNFIYSLIDKNNIRKRNSNKTPEELLSEVGYELYECKNEKDIQQFRKYYAPGEELCTFNGGRLNTNYVFFAVKKNINEIKREDFPNPQRQDLYGTSVISIQFTKDISHTVSIKNRYNHTVINPDATFSNNLDNIVPGLTESFAAFYGMKQTNPNINFEIEGYVRAIDGKYYKYNYEIDNIYYCPNNIIIDNFEVKRFEKEKYLVLDYFVLDLINKKISLYDEEKRKTKDSFPESIGEIDKIEIKNDGENKIVYITPKVGEIIMIELDKYNCIISLINSNINAIDDAFLWRNKKLKTIKLVNLQVVGKYFLLSNNSLINLSLPNLKKIGSSFLFSNQTLKKLELPCLEKVDTCFLYQNNILEFFSAPRLQKIDKNFLSANRNLNDLELPYLTYLNRDGFLEWNSILRSKVLKELKELKERQNVKLEGLDLEPNIIKM